MMCVVQLRCPEMSIFLLRYEVSVTYSFLFKFSIQPFRTAAGASFGGGGANRNV